MKDWFDDIEFPRCSVCKKKAYCLKANRIGMLLTRYYEECSMFEEDKL